jgi:hypothetical protein
MALSRR